LFGKEFAVNEHLAFALQFSEHLTNEQRRAQRRSLSREVQDLANFIRLYRDQLSDEVFQSQQYSVKLIAIPKVGNASRSDLSVEFVKWDALTTEEREPVSKLLSIVKDKRVPVEGVNVGRHRPSAVVGRILAGGVDGFNMASHTFLWKTFGVRPSKGAADPFATNTKYCYYNEPHEDYLYTDAWVDFIVKVLRERRLDMTQSKAVISDKSILGKLDISHYE
jgi:hypothetical protein